MHLLLSALIALTIALAPAGVMAAEKGGRIAGEITAITDESIVVQPQASKKDADPQAVTVLITDKTKVAINKEAADVSELEVGDQVTVNGAADADGNVVAKRINVTRDDGDDADEPEDDQGGEE